MRPELDLISQLFVAAAECRFLGARRIGCSCSRELQTHLFVCVSADEMQRLGNTADDEIGRASVLV